MTSYAIAHAFRGCSYVATLTEDGSIPQIIKLKDEKAKEEFLVNTLQPGDRVLTDLGGSADRLALVASFRRCEVSRIATFKIGNKEAVLEALKRREWQVEEESASGGETSDDLTMRKARALAIALASLERHHEFVVNREEDRNILLIKQQYRSYRVFQKTLIAAFQRVLSTMNDRYILELAAGENPDEAGKLMVLSGKTVNTESALRAIRAMLTEIPDAEREAFLAKVGVTEKLTAKKVMKRKDVDKLFKNIIEALLEGGVMSAFMKSMQDTKKSIEKMLKAEKIFRDVFDPLPGCGPLIAARIIAAVVDIRRFEGLPQLKAFAGYHLFEDGSRARRRAGKVSNWNTELKQAVYLWTQQTLKLPNSPWRARLDLRRGYELYKLLASNQFMANCDGLNYEILPLAFRDRTIACVNDIAAADLGVLAAHVDILRKQAGIKPRPADEDEEDSNEDADAAEEVIVASAKDPKLAKLVKGLKMKALQKACRWLGQQLLKYIFTTWRYSLGLTAHPPRLRNQPTPPVTPVTMESYGEGAMLQLQINPCDLLNGVERHLEACHTDVQLKGRLSPGCRKTRAKVSPFLIRSKLTSSESPFSFLKKLRE